MVGQWDLSRAAETAHGLAARRVGVAVVWRGVSMGGEWAGKRGAAVAGSWVAWMVDAMAGQWAVELGHDVVGQ